MDEKAACEQAKKRLNEEMLERKMPHIKKIIQSMLEKKIIFGGVLSVEEGFKMFERLPLEKVIEQLDNSRIAFATGSMGRAIFQITEDGKIKSVKGVDSHLLNDEIYMTKLVDSQQAYVTLNNESYDKSTYPLNLVKFPGKHPDLRWRGASPIEDLKEEAEVNAKLQGSGIKLPIIKWIRGFNVEFAEKKGLPIKSDNRQIIDESNLSDKDRYLLQRERENEELLKEFYGDKYQPEEWKSETAMEYFERLKLNDNEVFRAFSEKTGVKIEEFAEYYDHSYINGASFGQTERILESPFRISDTEYFYEKGDIEAVELISEFTQILSNSKIPFENIFATQMGANIANLMNAGWSYDRVLHRQDFSLAGEMCDDMYFYLPEKHYDIERYKTMYTFQIFSVGSTIKVLQDEMRKRGKSENEIESVMEDYVAKISFGNEDVELLQAHQGFNDWYNEMAEKLARVLDINRSLIKSGVEAANEVVASNQTAIQMDVLRKKFAVEKEIEVDTRKNS